MSELLIPSWLPAALTGGLAGSGLTLTINWIRTGLENRSARASRLRALIQELRHTKWLIEYNYDRIRNTNLLHKGLANIGTSIAEQVLFGTISLRLKNEITDHLHDYLQQVVYHNNLFAEYMALLPAPVPQRSTVIDRKITCMNEMAAICTPNPTYKDRSEPSLLARVERLLNELEKIKT